MTDAGGPNRRLLVGMHDGVCAIRSSDGGKTWGQGSVTPLAHAAARLTVSPVPPRFNVTIEPPRGTMTIMVFISMMLDHRSPVGLLGRV